jgi:hypothetical protein
MKELKAYLYCTSLKDLRLDEPGRSNLTYKALGAGFWALKQKDFRQAIQDIVHEVNKNQKTKKLAIKASFLFLKKKQNKTTKLRSKKFVLKVILVYLHYDLQVLNLCNSCTVLEELI